MSYLKFEKNQLANLEYSLQREILRSNRAGSYISTTLSGCNTRKYHGLFICPIDELDGEKHVLLSSLDETIIQHGYAFNLGIHKYGGDRFEPKGHKYIFDFEIGRIPKTTYRVGDVVLSKERILVEKEKTLLIRYKLEEANSATVIRFQPFLAFRNIHQLSKSNLYVNVHYTEIRNGAKFRLYDGYPYLNLQFSKEPEFIPAPVWYYGIEYPKEQNRGYDYQEDLFVPGYFEIPLKPGETLIFSASLTEGLPAGFRRKFTSELEKRVVRDSFDSSLANAARQFFVRNKNHTDLLAGYPWYGPVTRQTFVALPGLTLDQDDPATFEHVLDSQIKLLQNGLFPKFPDKPNSSYDSADAPLWFFWALQQYFNKTHDGDYIWKKYGPAMKSILNAYRAGTGFNIRMLENGLIEASAENVALTWMDSYVDGKPVVQRAGIPVEINALWYNAIKFACELALINLDRPFLNEWVDRADAVGKSFVETFWSNEKQYLADHILDGVADWAIRPNMLIAAALDHSPLTREMQKAVLSTVKQELLTPRGIRTLSPRDPRYKGNCMGNIRERELTIHQGTAWPWMISFFVELYLKIHRKGGLSFVEKIIEGFEEEMTENCIGTISEMYDGNPPHRGKGAISQAWSVAALIRANRLLESFKE